jgi:excisionase family DNA binding protein
VPRDSQDQQRQKLLTLLFGAEIPHVLEGQLLRTADVAVLFEVSERTVSEWAKKGQIPSVRTPGGHRRYPAEGIRWLLEQSRQGGVRPTQPDLSREGTGASVTHLNVPPAATA